MDFETILTAVNTGWSSRDTSAILPLLSLNYQSDHTNWLFWKNIGLIYSEGFADLRNMDRKGGLYMRGMPYHNRLTISDQGISLASISGQAIAFSELNIYGPGNGDGSFSSVIDTVGDLSPVFCHHAQPDLQHGFIILVDTISGLIHSILSLNKLEGTYEGVRC